MQIKREQFSDDPEDTLNRVASTMDGLSFLEIMTVFSWIVSHIMHRSMMSEDDAVDVFSKCLKLALETRMAGKKPN